MRNPPAAVALSLRHRRRGIRAAAASVAAGAALLAATVTATASDDASGGASRAAAAEYAPYTDMSAGQVGQLDTAITQHGLKQFSAAFTLGVGCEQIWGDTLPVGESPNIDPLISKAQSQGASVIISSGGAAGLPLAWTCKDQGKIEAGLQKVIDIYKVKSLDFDVEGAAVHDTAAAKRQFTAMKKLKAANPGLTFSVTLPVLPTGLTAEGVGVVEAAKEVGVKIDVLNIMAMDYYQGSQDMGKAAIAAAQATLGQMQGVDSSYTYANLGITPMIGENDDGSVFQLDDAAEVKSWAGSNGVGRLSFWSINRDRACTSAQEPAQEPAPGNQPKASPTCSGISQSPLAFTDAFK